jgi:hypothetical protein
VIDRILECKRTENDRIDPSKYLAWNKVIEVVLRPASRLTDAQKKVVAHEYSMRNQCLELPTRKALVPYVLRQLPIITSDPNSKQNQLEVVNSSAINATLNDLGVHFTF